MATAELAVLLGGRAGDCLLQRIDCAGGTLAEEGDGRILGRVLRGEAGQNAIIEKRHGGLGAKTAVLLNLAESVGKRPALNDKAIQTHPGGGTVHAGVAVDQDRPRGRVLGKDQVRATNASPDGSSPWSLPM